ncbi:mechanosensitive ion channel family protein [bacterium endosymbiont of Bathymodiolus sp. 5 South]|jgi:MscS family membrane protein|uniref:mechanosensitive ion channel family protein n=1 Tax=bacterium endosymbiont of Bathymodiolus sp. 5 South TaxID=1181670 RepID=UPI0010BAF886|nr:mechanosensitive ion channel family protein [bacterium endosymbiont of Bathymodiolus sp. 5 South]CAC9649816.1 Small-conductance mechanosensitive channel [uncultured Gammaproteobacteria bacterium]CAC9653896.1 Small-conductance mechanosensitive channel [uncultured Gammaproteobacteria bacterium]SHN93036.1 Small-conductance mechanosensitive channel [bacterium endosymbiont of Bathymodiolus sp. 5 South]VVH55206.1 Small-conductance mechanosensitive channel [uncultured Gammaproteobacteria bacterium]
MDFLQNLTLYQTVGVLFAAAFIVHITTSTVLKQLITQADKTKNQLDDYLLKSISAPIKALVWFAWFYLSINALKGEVALLAQVINYIDILPISIITWGVLRMISGTESYLLEYKDSTDKDSVRLIARLIKILIIASIVLGVAQYFGFSISGLLTFGGVGGIVMGFAAKDMLSNIFGGLMLQMDRPFSTGDWIRSSQFEGTVEKIGWRMTRIRTFSKNPIYIPNSIFASIPIETPSRMTNRRINEVIGIRYDDIAKIPAIITEVEAMLKAHKEIDQSQALRVYFNYFNASSLDCNIVAFTKTTSKDKYQQVKQKILLNIADIITKHKAEIAYPTQTLHIQK